MRGFGRGKWLGHKHRDAFVTWQLLGVALFLVFWTTCKCNLYLLPSQTRSAFSLASFAYSLSDVTASILSWSKIVIDTKNKATHCNLFLAILRSSKGSICFHLNCLRSLDAADWCSLTLWSYFGYQRILSCPRLPNELWDTGRRSRGIKTREAKSVDARLSSNGNSLSFFGSMKT